MKQILTNSCQGAKSIARHCFSILLCIAICANFIACCSEEELIPTVSPTDDASLLEEQLKELDSRGTNSSIVMMILTKINPSFIVTRGILRLTGETGAQNCNKAHTNSHTPIPTASPHILFCYMAGKIPLQN